MMIDYPPDNDGFSQSSKLTGISKYSQSALPNHYQTSFVLVRADSVVQLWVLSQLFFAMMGSIIPMPLYVHHTHTHKHTFFEMFTREVTPKMI